MSPFSVPWDIVRFIAMIKHTRTIPARAIGKRSQVSVVTVQTLIGAQGKTETRLVASTQST